MAAMCVCSRMAAMCVFKNDSDVCMLLLKCVYKCMFSVCVYACPTSKHICMYTTTILTQRKHTNNENKSICIVFGTIQFPHVINVVHVCMSQKANTRLH